MKPIDGVGANGVTRLNSGGTPRVSASDAGRAVTGDQATARQTVTQNMSPTRAVAGPSAPVDADRVAMIRKAVEQGRYPVVPSRIADAMIAAGYLLRTPK